MQQYGLNQKKEPQKRHEYEGDGSNDHYFTVIVHRKNK